MKPRLIAYIHYFDWKTTPQAKKINKKILIILFLFYRHLLFIFPNVLGKLQIIFITSCLNQLAQRAEGETETTAQTEGHEEGIGPRVRRNGKSPRVVVLPPAPDCLHSFSC